MAGSTLSRASLDTFFEPIGTATKAADVGLQIGGVDISNFYYPIASGGAVGAVVTNFKKGGADIKGLFAKLGTVSYQSITWAGIISISAGGTTAQTASITLNNDGTTVKAGTGTVVGDYLSPTGVGDGANYECQAINIVGDPIAGATTWTSITTNQVFSIFSGVGTKTATFDLQIRSVADPATVLTRAVTLTATVTGGGA